MRFGRYESGMTFWFLVLLITLFAMLVVGGSAIRNQNSAALDISHDKALYTARIREIDTDLELGRFDAEAAQAAKAEEARKLIRAGSSAQAHSGNFAYNKWIVVAVLLFLPAFSLPLYGMLGAPQVLMQSDTMVSGNDNRQQSIDNLLVAAETRLESSPDDARGWIVVAPVYMRLGRYADAANAYRNALRLEGGRADLMAGLGEALIGEAEGKVTTEAARTFQDALQLDGRNFTARYYLGVAALQDNDKTGARKIWQAMVDNAEGDESWLGSIRKRIAELDGDTPETPQ